MTVYSTWANVCVWTCHCSHAVWMCIWYDNMLATHAVNAADNKQRDPNMKTIKIVIDPWVCSNTCRVVHTVHVSPLIIWSESMYMEVGLSLIIHVCRGMYTFEASVDKLWDGSLYRTSNTHIYTVNRIWSVSGMVVMASPLRCIRLRKCMFLSWYSGPSWPPLIMMMIRRKSQEAGMAMEPNCAISSALSSLLKQHARSLARPTNRFLLLSRNLKQCQNSSLDVFLSYHFRHGRTTWGQQAKHALLPAAQTIPRFVNTTMPITVIECEAIACASGVLQAWFG